MKKKYYCGPYYAPKWILKPLSYVFNYPCRIHDQSYSEGKIPRLKIELTFLVMMIKTLILLLHKILKQTFKFIIGCCMCPLFFILVVLFGWISYNRKIEDIDSN
jgi:hypothetical protein